MPESRTLSDSELASLREVDSPTVANALERLDLRDRSVDLSGVGDVAPDVEGALGGAAAARRDRDLVAVRHERLRDRSSDAAVPTGHQDRAGCRLGGFAHGATLATTDW